MAQTASASYSMPDCDSLHPFRTTRVGCWQAGTWLPATLLFTDMLALCFRTEKSLVNKRTTNMAFTLQRTPCSSSVIAFTTLPLMLTTRNRTKVARKHRPTLGIGSAVQNLQMPLQHAPVTVRQPSQARTLRQAPAVTQQSTGPRPRTGLAGSHLFILLCSWHLPRSSGRSEPPLDTRKLC